MEIRKIAGALGIDMLSSMAGISVPYRRGGDHRYDQRTSASVLRQHAVSGAARKERRAVRWACPGRRSDALKDVPTVAESGFPGFDVNPWFGILAPAGTPAAAVNKINADVNRMLAQKDVIDRFTSLGAVPFATTPEQFAKIAHNDIVKWTTVVKESGATID